MTVPSLSRVELYGKPDCHLCDEAKALLKQLQAQYPFTLHEINILEHADLAEQYAEEIPVVFIDGHKAFKYRIDPQQFIRRLQRGQTGQQRWQRLWPW